MGQNVTMRLSRMPMSTLIRGHGTVVSLFHLRILKNYGIDPRKIIEHLTIESTLVNRDTDRKSIVVRFNLE